MKITRYVLLGCLTGLLTPVCVAVVSAVSRHTFESWAIAVVIAGFLPFGSVDPEHEMSWVQVAVALCLNAAFFGLVGLLVGISNKGYKPVA